ncbi:MAG TPA: GntR family transcriptional regulator [Pseudonocardia sp.]|jgi:DNA-binding GntR family transcriptional regulator|nr:GntR family transcriptional regulator [Pseudonocardia sp.]
MDEAIESTHFAAERVAAALRREVTEGALGADERLKDNDLAERFGVSRNTAREALRLVASEGLVVLRRHTGAAVRSLTLADVHDIYRVRRTVECSAVLDSHRAAEHLFDATSAAVTAAEKCVERRAWHEAVTASLDVHIALVALGESERLAHFFAQQLAQLRIAFWALPIETDVQEGWIARDREIVDLVLGGKRDKAALELRQYLDDSEARLVDALRAQGRAARGH